MMLVAVVMAACAVGALGGPDQSIRVTGTLLCTSAKDGEKAWVEIYDDDSGNNDDDMDSATITFTNGRATFDLQGYASDPIGNIDVHFKAYHDCRDHKPCQRRYKTKINDDYVESGRHPTRPYNLGEIRLDNVMEGEERDCNPMRSASIG